MEQKTKLGAARTHVHERPGRHAVLKALRDRPAVGVRELLERVPAASGVTERQALAELRSAIARGLVVREIEGPTVRLSLARSLQRRRRTASASAPARGRCRLAATTSRAPTAPTRGLGRATVVMGAALLAAGCVSTPPAGLSAAVRNSGVSAKPFVGIEQVLDSHAVPQFVACSECAVPTPKTLRVAAVSPAVAPAVALAITPAPESGAPAIPSTKRETVAALAHGETPTAVLFAPGSSRLTSSSLKRIDAFAAAAREARAVYVRGATDDTGDATRNEVLARNRAAVVRAALMSRGVARSAIHIDACTDCFVDSNAHDVGRQANRRVELSLAPPAAPSQHAARSTRP